MCHGYLSFFMEPQFKVCSTHFFVSFVDMLGMSFEVDKKLSNRDTLLPHFFFAVKNMENLIRAHLSHVVYQIIRIFVFGILNVIVPYGYVSLEFYGSEMISLQRYWSPPSAVIDLGDKCEYGMAYMVNGYPQQEPSVFQCNVGYTVIGVIWI